MSIETNTYVGGMRQMRSLASIYGADKELRGEFYLTCRRRDWTIVDGLITLVADQATWMKWGATNHLTLRGQRAVVTVKFVAEAGLILALQRQLLPYHVGA